MCARVSLVNFLQCQSDVLFACLLHSVDSKRANRAHFMCHILSELKEFVQMPTLQEISSTKFVLGHENRCRYQAHASGICPPLVSLRSLNGSSSTFLVPLSSVSPPSPSFAFPPPSLQLRLPPWQASHSASPQLQPRDSQLPCRTRRRCRRSCSRICDGKEHIQSVSYCRRMSGLKMGQ